MTKERQNQTWVDTLQTEWEKFLYKGFKPGDLCEVSVEFLRVFEYKPAATLAMNGRVSPIRFQNKSSYFGTGTKMLVVSFEHSATKTRAIVLINEKLYLVDVENIRKVE